MKRTIALLLSVLMALSLLAGCGGSASEPAAPAAEESGAAAPAAENAPEAEPVAAEPGEPVYGGSATLYYSDFNTVFDPAMGEQYTYSLWLEYLFTMDWEADDDGLFKNNNFTLDTAQGQIAKEWTWDPDTCDFTVTIRDDIYFQEKAPEYDIFHARNLTAADVKYSYDRVIGIGSGFDADNYVVIDGDWRNRLLGDLDPNFSASGEPSGESSEEPAEEAPAEAPDRDFIEVIDDYTLVFHMASASEIALSDFIIAQVNITGPEWDTLTDEQKLDWHYACGTGPYILTDYVADNHYTFTKNENYYDYDERYPENKLPYLDTITLQKYGDSTSVLSDFFAGKLDYVSQYANLSDSEITQLTANAAVQKYSYPYQAAGIGLKCNASASPCRRPSTSRRSPRPITAMMNSSIPACGIWARLAGPPCPTGTRSFSTSTPMTPRPRRPCWRRQAIRTASASLLLSTPLPIPTCSSSRRAISPPWASTWRSTSWPICPRAVRSSPIPTTPRCSI